MESAVLRAMCRTKQEFEEVVEVLFEWDGDISLRLRASSLEGKKFLVVNKPKGVGLQFQPGKKYVMRFEEAE